MRLKLKPNPDLANHRKLEALLEYVYGRGLFSLPNRTKGPQRAGHADHY